jgi:hypothetical protein
VKCASCSDDALPDSNFCSKHAGAVLGDRPRRSDDILEARTPLGWFRLTGRTAVIAALLVALGFFLLRHEQRAEAANAAVISALHEMAWVLTLDEGERKQLRLTMPSSMRERLLRIEKEPKR